MIRQKPRLVRVAAVIAALGAIPASAVAQIDPLFFMKTYPPNVIFLVDTSNRMQRDVPSTVDLTNATTTRDTSNYYDPFSYPKTGALYETQSLGIDGTNTTTSYRRKFEKLSLYNPGNPDKGQTTHITAVGDKVPGPLVPGPTAFTMFEAPTRLSIARAAMYQAVNENKNVVRFGLVKMRQSSPAMPTDPQLGTVFNGDTLNQTISDAAATKWNIHRPVVSADNGKTAAAANAMVKADTATDDDLLNILKKAPADGGLIPAGNDTSTDFDTPVKLMLDDAYTEAKRLVAINSDPTCRNTVVVMIVGGGEGTTAGFTNANLETVAKTFINLNASGRRVPIHVIALAPPVSDAADLAKIATASGGTYTEITKDQVNNALNSKMQQETAGLTAPAGTVIVPEVVNAINYAIQQTFAASTDFNDGVNTPTAYGKSTEFQVTSPIIGTVNLNMAKDINGNLLPNPQPPDVKDKQGTVIPQRNNVMLTTGVVMPGFEGKLRAFRVYKPVADASQPSGYKFSADGTRLWVASTPADPNQRNLFTATADGTMIAFSTDPVNLPTLAALMNLNTTDATTVINAVRKLPLGAVIDSTPALMNSPSLDPPPDDAYPGFAVANKDRRTIIWAGTNRGMLEAIDARTGLEVWGFIPLNLLPKLRTLLDGQPVGKFDYFMDGSPKISDVRLDGICPAASPSQCWRTHLIVGEGPGGTFYQSFDVTLDGIGTTILPDSSDTTALLTWFSVSTRVKLNWSFPSYSHFDVCAPLTSPCSPIATYGDVHATNATAIEKTVGQTWSDPAVGQIYSSKGPYSVLLGSGFLPYTVQRQSNRFPTTGQSGTTFYIADAKTGTIYASSDVGSDGINETVDDCTTNADGCKKMKNALQTDPVATGPSDQRFITKAYIGDLDGTVWRFDISLDGLFKPKIDATNKLFTVSTAGDQPIFSSMATVNVGGSSQYIFFGTGSDLLPATKGTPNHLIGVLDSGGATGTSAMDFSLAKTSTLSSDERVTAFPAVAGDIVFFTTTTFKEAIVTDTGTAFSATTTCSAPDAKLYALTFKGGPAYDTNNDGKFDNNDKTLVTTIAGQRATAPFIVDQHLVFGTQGKISMFGDPDDFNNGIGQAGVRILSWREVR